MSVVVLLIVAGGVVAAGFLAAFAWAVQSGQYDDTCTPAVRMLFEHEPARRRAGDAAGEFEGRSPSMKQEGMSHVDVDH
jgi:cbb3-type cytochrome oxidase maturation protein